MQLSFVLIDNWISLTPKEANTKFMQLDKKLNSLQSYSIKVTQRTFQNYTTQKSAFQYVGFVHKNDKNFRTLLMGIYTIQNNKYKLNIDTTNKIILISDPTQEQPEMTMFSAQNEKMLEACKTIKSKNENKKEYISLTYSEKTKFKTTDLIFTEDGLPVSIKLFLNYAVAQKKDAKTEKPRIEMEYTEHNLKTKFSEAEFSEKKYIQVLNSKIVPTAAYQTYIIKDLRIQSKK